MGNSNASEQLASKILKSIFRSGGNKRTQRHSFLFGKPGCNHWEKRLGTEIYYDSDELLEAAFYSREVGASYLKRIPIAVIESKLTNLVSENYGIWGYETFGKMFDSCYLDFISEEAIRAFSDAIEHSNLFKPTNVLVAFPLQVVSVQEEFVSKHFQIVKPHTLADIKYPINVSLFDVKPDKFPPSERHSNKFYELNSWLCVTAPNLEAAKKKKAAILGAMALKYKDGIRYQCNSVDHMGGYCLFSDSMTTSFGNAHTPSVLQKLKVDVNDRFFLSTLNDILSSESVNDFKKIRALEYFYRAWFLDESERFPFLFMCLESLYGDGHNANQSVITGIKSAISDELSEQRLRLLAGLRGSIVHGGAPEIYDSRKYAKYYKKYKVCPSKDLSVLVASCINQTVFNGAIHKQPDEHQAIIDEARASGKITDYIELNIMTGVSINKGCE